MEKISALIDGELDAPDGERQLARCEQDPEARACWDTYHLIGDAMRGKRMLAANVASRVSERLAQEPTVLAPRPRPAARVPTYALTAAASISAAAFVGWMAFQSPFSLRSLTTATAPALPTNTAPLTPPAPVAVTSVPDDGKMKEYLIAHQEFSPSTAIQGLAPYVRTVSAAGPAAK